MVHIINVTMIISLPETFDLFDEIILLSEGSYLPKVHEKTFFYSVGFKCPERKGVAEFLQEQYWSIKNVSLSI